MILIKKVLNKILKCDIILVYPLGNDNKKKNLKNIERPQDMNKNHKNSIAAKLQQAKININYSVRMLAACKNYTWSARVLFTDVKEIEINGGTMEECKNKIAEIEKYLAENPDIVNDFENMKEGNGCTGRIFLDTAKKIIEKF